MPNVLLIAAVVALLAALVSLLIARGARHVTGVLSQLPAASASTVGRPCYLEGAAAGSPVHTPLSGQQCVWWCEQTYDVFEVRHRDRDGSESQTDEERLVEERRSAEWIGVAGAIGHVWVRAASSLGAHRAGS